MEELIKELRFHQLMYEDGHIDGNDLSNALKQVLDFYVQTKITNKL